MISNFSHCKSVSAAECHNHLENNLNLSNGVTRGLDKICIDSAGKVKPHSDLKRMPNVDIEDKSFLISVIKEMNKNILFS